MQVTVHFTPCQHARLQHDHCRTGPAACRRLATVQHSKQCNQNRCWRQCHHNSTAVIASAAASSDTFANQASASNAAEAVQPSPASTQPASHDRSAHLPACRPQDILRAITADGSELFLEVLSGIDPSTQQPPTPEAQQGVPMHQQQEVQVAHQGVVYSLSLLPLSHQQAGSTDSSSSSGDSSSSRQFQYQLKPQGWLLKDDADLVKALPGWPAALKQQQSKQPLPTEPLLLQSVAVAYSAAALQAAVQQNPALWRDGTGPNDPPLQGLQYQLLSAGEIESLLCGARGVVMVQLSVGWDAAAQLPVYNCLVINSLRRALARKDISIFMSSAPGGLGLTAILTAKVEPFRSWGAHLASFGAQAALVADSPYYKLLIGRVLGYAEQNIRHHILATTGRQIPDEVVAAVDKDLAKISKQKPRLPWTATAATAGNSSSSSGGRRQQQQQPPRQQLSRSARKKQRG